MAYGKTKQLGRGILKGRCLGTQLEPCSKLFRGAERDLFYWDGDRSEILLDAISQQFITSRNSTMAEIFQPAFLAC